jgi:hypothetical protein
MDPEGLGPSLPAGNRGLGPARLPISPRVLKHFVSQPDNALRLTGSSREKGCPDFLKLGATHQERRPSRSLTPQPLRVRLKHRKVPHVFNEAGLLEFWRRRTNTHGLRISQFLFRWSQCLPAPGHRLPPPQLVTRVSVVYPYAGSGTRTGRIACAHSRAADKSSWRRRRSSPLTIRAP